jgi:hypothetical protein
MKTERADFCQCSNVGMNVVALALERPQDRTRPVFLPVIGKQKKSHAQGPQ